MVKIGSVLALVGNVSERKLKFNFFHFKLNFAKSWALKVENSLHVDPPKFFFSQLKSIGFDFYETSKKKIEN